MTTVAAVRASHAWRKHSTNDVARRDATALSILGTVGSNGTASESPTSAASGATFETTDSSRRAVHRPNQLDAGQSCRCRQIRTSKKRHGHRDELHRIPGTHDSPPLAPRCSQVILQMYPSFQHNLTSVLPRQDNKSFCLRLISQHQFLRIWWWCVLLRKDLPDILDYAFTLPTQMCCNSWPSCCSLSFLFQFKYFSLNAINPFLVLNLCFFMATFDINWQIYRKKNRENI